MAWYLAIAAVVVGLAIVYSKRRHKERRKGWSGVRDALTLDEQAEHTAKLRTDREAELHSIDTPGGPRQDPSEPLPKKIIKKILRKKKK